MTGTSRGRANDKRRNDRLYKAGLCRVCAKYKRRDGLTKCESCAAQVSLRAGRLYEAGLCRVCAKNEREDGLAKCKACTANVASYAKKRRSERLLKKTCPICGKRRLAKGKAACRTCLKREAGYHLESYYKNHERMTAKRKEYTKALRLEVFNGYGGAFCRCCGESEYVFLTIDHMNNDGAAHRREVGRGLGVFRWLRDNGFPPGYQVLCWCCNEARRLVGVCPHQINGVK